jgi:HD-like signal output (HDOD) protein
MNKLILEQIKSLPPLPKSVMEVQRITNDPNSSIKDLVKVIKEDPMLTTNLLKAANSPLYGFRRKITNIDQAVALFGMSTVKGFAISFAIRNSLKFNLSAYGIDENIFHDVEMKRNALSINWYRLDKNRLDIMATDSFLIDIGAVLISLVLVMEGEADEFRARLTPENRYSLEEEFVGANTFEVTAELFKHWNFSEELTIPMANILTPSKAGKYEICAKSLDVVRTAFDLLDFDNEDNLAKALRKIEEYQLDKTLFLKALEIINKGY